MSRIQPSDVRFIRARTAVNKQLIRVKGLDVELVDKHGRWRGQFRTVTWMRTRASQLLQFPAHPTYNPKLARSRLLNSNQEVPDA
jgi:hypothetical protein